MRVYMLAILSTNINASSALELIEDERGFNAFLEGHEAFEAFIKPFEDWAAEENVNMLLEKKNLEETFWLDPDPEEDNKNNS